MESKSYSWIQGFGVNLFHFIEQRLYTGCPNKHGN